MMTKGMMMRRSAVLGGIFAVVLFVLTTSVHAANKAKSSAAATHAVQESLLSETAETNTSIDRRDRLNPGAPVKSGSKVDSGAKVATGPQAKIDVWWQAGYVKSGNEWLPYEKTVVSGDDAIRLDEYLELRDKLSEQPHGQWKLATWCRKNGLTDQERVHLLRVLADRDPSVNIDGIYERLGCQKIDGVWISEHERREAAELKSEIELSHQRWDSKLKILAQNLEATPKQHALAEKKLAEITQPSAVPALVSSFCLSTQSLADYGIKTLGQIPEYQASRALAGQAVFSPWKPVRTKATQLLKDRKLTEFAPDLLMLLSAPIRTKVELNVQASPSSVIASPGPAPHLKVNWDYVWVEETNDTIRVGIRRLFPISIPANLVDVYSMYNPGARGSFDATTGRRVSSAPGASKIIAQLELSAQTDQLDYAADKINDSRKDLNERVGSVLSACTTEPMTSDAKEWWNWWSRYSNVAYPTQKYEVVDARPPTPSLSIISIQKSCLVAGTLVWTERGHLSIEKIRPGDRVLSKNVSSGELSYKPVLLTTVREPTPVQQFSVAGDKIMASLGHHFWVSGEGWTKTRELADKQPLHTVTGMQRITSIEDPGRVETVYNLVVADFHTFFVGEAMVLSHDVSFPALTNVKVPGLAIR